MYDLFIGNYERVMGKIVFHKFRNSFIPCLVTNYYFKSRQYALVPTEDMSIPTKNASTRRLYYTNKVYVPFGYVA
ncbi:MAG: hypothetical protein GX638_09015 [Crenarchaeota archaeon]|nr:hypothetical protein [Thermoproteota archaeon]